MKNDSNHKYLWFHIKNITGDNKEKFEVVQKPSRVKIFINYLKELFFP